MTAPLAPSILPVTATNNEAIIVPPLTNLALNPGMYPPTFHWAIYRSSISSVTSVAAAAKSGGYGARLFWKAKTTPAVGRGELVLTGLAIGQKYGVGLAVRVPNSRSPQVRLHIYGGAFANDSAASAHKNGTWERLTLYFTAAAASHRIQLINDTTTASSTPGYVDFDELMIQAMADSDEVIGPWFSGDSGNGAVWTGASANSPSTMAAIINPDAPFYMNWAYHADATSHYDHWKSAVSYQKFVGGVWTNFTFADINIVAVKTTGDGRILHTQIIPQPTNLLGDGGSYRILIKDTNVLGNQGPSSFIQFTTPVRPVISSITPAYNAGSPPAVNHLPLLVQWVADHQIKYRIKAYMWNATDGATIANPFYVYDTGWINSSVRSGLVWPRVSGAKLALRLYVHDGLIASAPTTTLINLASVITRDEEPIRGLELEVYDGISGDFIDVLPNRILPSFLDELRGPCGGSATIKFDDPNYTANPNLIKARNIVRVRDRGQYIGFWVITGHEPKSIGQGESAEEVITVKGVGGYGIWPSDAVVFPEDGRRNFSRHFPTMRKTRSFGAASNATDLDSSWFDSTRWQFPYQEARQDGTIPPGGTNPWANNPTDWPSDLTHAYWMWTDDQTAFSRGGIVVFKSSINNTQSVPITIKGFLAADDSAQVFIDGDPWFSSNGWGTTSASDIIWIAPGAHTITIIAQVGFYSSDIAAPTMPAGVLFGLYSYGAAAGTGTADPHAVSLLSGSSNFICIGYTVLPSWTLGDILQLLYREAVRRGVTSFKNFQLGFDDEFDSKGIRWQHDGSQWQFDHFTGYDQVLAKITDSTCEVWFDKDLIMQAARNRGVDRGWAKSPASYVDVVNNASPAFFFTFMTGLVRVTFPAGALAGFLGTSTITSDAIFDDTGNAVVFPSTLSANRFFAFAGWTIPTQTGGSWSPQLNPPGEDITGMQTIAAKIAANGTQTLTISNVNYLDPTDGDTQFSLTGDDGFAFEFVTSDAWWELFFWHTPPEYNIATDYLTPLQNTRINWNDDTFAHFESGVLQVIAGDNNSPNVNVVNVELRNDNRSYHWVVNFVSYGDTDALVIVYRDGVEIAACAATLAAPLAGIYVDMVQQYGSTGHKSAGAFGMVALYQRLLTEDEIYSHATSWQGKSVTPHTGINKFVPVEPVIFRRAKNVVSAGATVDFSAKTALIATSKDSVREVRASSTDLAKYGRIEGYYDGSSKENADARRVANQAVEASLRSQTSQTIEVTDHLIPWVDFGVGDWVLTPGDYGEDLVRRRIMSIAAAEDEATGRTTYQIEVDSLTMETEHRLTLWMTRTLPQGNLDGLITDTG